MEYDYLVSLRRNHPAWRLLAAEHAPMVISFLYRTFVEPNVRTLSEQDLSAKLEDLLYHLRSVLGDDAFPRPALDYLSDWADDNHAWLRRYYPADSDEPHYDLTPAAEQAIHWLSRLERREFVGAESRLKVVVDLLREIAHGSQTDPKARIAELERRRNEIEAEIAEIRGGRINLMDDTQLRERFWQATDVARELLADFRQVEQNFRELDRQARERIATWDGGKGEVLDEVFGERDAIAQSDQGRSFHAFWDFLMSPRRQEELSALLELVFELDAVQSMRPDPRLKRIHYDWLTAGEATQRTVARLSEQLRRFLDDQAWHENRRIMELLRKVEQHALAVREAAPTQELMSVDATHPTVELPMDRPLFKPPIKPRIGDDPVVEGDDDIPADALFEQTYVDKEVLRARLRRALQDRRQISLGELIDRYPLEQGLAELVAWMSLATGEGVGVIDEERSQAVTWVDADGLSRKATMPTVIFFAGGAGPGSGRNSNPEEGRTFSHG